MSFDTIFSKEIVEELSPGHEYSLPTYKFDESGNNIIMLPQEEHIPLRLLILSKDGDKMVTHTGTIHEHVVAALIYDLKKKNVYAQHSHINEVVKKLQESLFWLRETNLIAEMDARSKPKEEPKEEPKSPIKKGPHVHRRKKKRR